MKEGIDAVIVDSVLAIRKGLTEGANEVAAAASAVLNGSVTTATLAPGMPIRGMSENDVHAAVAGVTQNGTAPAATQISLVKAVK